MNEEQKNNITEKILKPASGGLMLILLLCALLITIGGMVGGSIMLGNHSYVSGGDTVCNICHPFYCRLYRLCRIKDRWTERSRCLYPFR